MMMIVCIASLIASHVVPLKDGLYPGLPHSSQPGQPVKYTWIIGGDYPHFLAGLTQLFDGFVTIEAVEGLCVCV